MIHTNTQINIPGIQQGGYPKLDLGDVLLAESTFLEEIMGEGALQSIQIDNRIPQEFSFEIRANPYTAILSLKF